MAYTFNGIGTTYYGQRDFHPDGSYITTEWFVLIFVPLIPIRSFRVREVAPDYYQVYARTWPNWRQVLFTYGYMSFLVAWVRFIAETFESHLNIGWTYSSPFILLLFFLPLPTPWLLRYYVLRGKNFDSRVYSKWRPRLPDADNPVVPCPYCGNPLATAASTQCRYCRKDWQDPKRVISITE